MKKITRFATGFVLVAGTALLALVGADRIEAAASRDLETVQTAGPSPEYAQAMAVSEAAEAEELANESRAASAASN